MLHATERNKSKLYQRYLPKRDNIERKERVPGEDEITSIIFGPLDFLCASDAHRFWLRVLETVGQAHFFPAAPPLEVSVAMWPRDKAKDDGNSIEPDMLVTVKWAGGVSRILLIELKWEADVGGTNHNQLHRQWQQYLDDEIRTNALHIFIAREVSAGVQAFNNEVAGGNVWKTKANENRLVLLPWFRVREVFNTFAEEKDSALGRWAKLADHFLDRIQIGKFGGFNNLANDISVPIQSFSTLFWHPAHSQVGASPECRK
jgi:hypothetical protein